MTRSFRVPPSSKDKGNRYYPQRYQGGTTEIGSVLSVATSGCPSEARTGAPVGARIILTLNFFCYRPLVDTAQVQDEFAFVCLVTGHDDGNTPVLLVEVACCVFGDVTVGGAVAGGGTSSNVQDCLGHIGVEHEGSGQSGGGAGAFQDEVLGGG